MIEEAQLPFVRTDRYGEGGWAPQPLWERVRLLVLACTLLPLRLLLCLSCITSYYLIVRITTIIPNEIIVRRIITSIGKVWSRMCLFCLGFVHIKWVRVGVSKEQRAVKRRSVAVVSNHMGWSDILIHMARYFPAFVARDGTQHLPMVGLISRRMQCLYVDREKKGTNSVGSSRPGTPETAAAATAAAVAAGDATIAPVVHTGGVSSAVKQRMLMTAQHPELELRPMLLFPEGTTTNGRYLLPFKTGAFLAGVPVLPTIIHYHTSSGDSDQSGSNTARITAAAAVAAAAAAASGLAVAGGASIGATAAAGIAAAGVAVVLGGSALAGTGGVSPCWESIDATRHLLLMMCQPFHTVTCYELPLYVPNEQEQSDPRLYAANVRQYMLQHSRQVAAAAAQARAANKPLHNNAAAPGMPLLASSGILEDKRAYQAGMRVRRKYIEAGAFYNAEQVFSQDFSRSSCGPGSTIAKQERSGNKLE